MNLRLMLFIFFISAVAFSMENNISYYELKNSPLDKVLKTTPKQRLQYEFKELSLAQATELKDQSNIWVLVPRDCQIKTPTFNDEPHCQTEMLHYSEYVRALNSHSL